MVRIKLKTIVCNVPEEIDKDEMYLKHQGKKFWPDGKRYFRIDVGDRVDVDHEIEVTQGWNEIELWDFDFTSRNDHLGTFKIKVDPDPGQYSASLIQNKKETATASYFLMWEVL